MSYKKMLPLVLAALLLWTVPASAAPETTLKVAVGDPEDSEMGVVGHAFKKYVEEKTGGKVEVQCFYGGSLGDESEAFRNVQKGTLPLAMGGIANLVLDPLFILPQFLGLGAVGAGMATCLSNVLSVVYFLLCLVRQRNESVIGLHPRHLRHSRKYLGNILAIGFPSALQYALTVVAVAAQSRFVSQYTTEAVAALGIVKKLDQLPLYFSIGVSNGLLPLLAYHYAAGQQEKRRAAFRLGAGISLLFALVCLVLFEGFAPQLAALFIDDATTIHYAAGFLRRMVIAMPMMSLCYPLIIQFQAMGKARESLVCSILRKGVLDIPLLFLMDTLFPLYGCMWVQPMVDGISLVAATAFYRRLRRRGEA